MPLFPMELICTIEDTSPRIYFKEVIKVTFIKC